MIRVWNLKNDSLEISTKFQLKDLQVEDGILISPKIRAIVRVKKTKKNCLKKIRFLKIERTLCDFSNTRRYGNYLRNFFPQNENYSKWPSIETG